MNASQILERIAQSLNQMANAGSNVWSTIAAPLLVSVVGVILGYIISMLNDFKQQRRVEQTEAKKRTWLRKLLDDEISLRWQKTIRPVLKNLAEIQNAQEAAHVFTTDIVISPDDLIIFRRISDSPYDYYFIGDSELMSQIIYGHVQMCDLVDYRRLIKQDCAKGVVSAIWLADLEKKLGQIDATFEKITHWRP